MATIDSREGVAAKIDRRVRRTRRQLHAAILALLVEQDYENITVHDITTRADVNRATFYHHFNNKDELLAAALEDRFDELVASFGDLSDKALWQDRTPEVMTFRHVAEHASLYKVLLSDRGMCNVVYRIIDYIARFSQSKLTMQAASTQGNAPSEFDIPLPIIAHHIAGSLFALLSWWLAHDMPYSPETMAEMSHSLCTNGVGCVFDDALPIRAKTEGHTAPPRAETKQQA